MFQVPEVLPLSEYFVLMVANDKRYKDVYDKGKRLLRGENVPNYWAIHFLKPDGTEIRDLYIEKNVMVDKLKEQMTTAIKQVGKGMPQTKYNKICDEYRMAAFSFEIHKLKDAKKDFEKFVKSNKIEFYLVTDAKEKVKKIEEMAKEMIDEAKTSIGEGDFESGFKTLYELELWYAGLPQKKDVGSAIKEMEDQHKDKQEAKEAIKKAKYNQQALKLYQKAQECYLKGKEAEGTKNMKKIEKLYCSTEYASMPCELIQVNLPTPKPVEAGAGIQKAGGSN